MILQRLWRYPIDSEMLDKEAPGRDEVFWPRRVFEDILKGPDVWMGEWWMMVFCFFFGSPQSYLDDGFGGWYFWMVIREVLFLFLFLVCTCSFVLLLRVFTSSESCPPLPSRLLLPLLLLYIPLLLLLLPLLPSSPSTQCAGPVVPIASKTVYGCLRYYSRLQSTGSSHRTHAVLNWSSWHGTPPLPYPALPPELYLRPY